MPVEKLPSGLVVGFREWEFDDMGRWAKQVQNGGSDDDLLVEASVSMVERVVDPGQYGWLKEGATAIDASRLLKRDVLWWLYRARAASHPDDPKRKLTGEDYVFDWQCSKNPRHVTAPVKARLCDLPMKPLPESSYEHVQTGKPLEKRLPNGDLVRFVIPTIGIDKPLKELLAKRTKELRQRQKGAKAVEATQAETVACQIVSISSLGENQSLERRAAYIGKLKFRDWAPLEKAIRDASPSINLDSDCYCDECGAKTVVTLPLTRGFFLPDLSQEEAETEQEEEKKDPEMDELEKTGAAAELATGQSSTSAP